LGDLPDDVRTHYRESGGYELLKRLLLIDKSRNASLSEFDELCQELV